MTIDEQVFINIMKSWGLRTNKTQRKKKNELDMENAIIRLKERRCKITKRINVIREKLAYAIYKEGRIRDK